LIASHPFPLRLSVVQRASNRASFIDKQIRKFRGIRRSKTIGEELSSNLTWFQGKQWSKLKHRLEMVPGGRGYTRERSAAEWLAAEFSGLGPKQSRNFLQVLGLTRYEIPIDSRIIKWLNEIGFPLLLTSQSLGDPGYYAFVNDGIREVCRAVGTYPCILDAVVFSRADGGRWNRNNIVF
jgi:hypothetical protein